MADKEYSAEIDALKKDITALRNDLSILVDTFKEDATQRASKARQNMESKWDAWEDRASRTAQESLDAVEKRIERSPMTAMLAAIGLGFLIGALIRRD